MTDTGQVRVASRSRPQHNQRLGGLALMVARPGLRSSRHSATGSCLRMCPMPDHKGLPILAFQSQADWDAWLAHHGAGSVGIWLKFAKKSASALSVSKPEAIGTALAHGWIRRSIRPRACA
jgi:hypothetical protein